MPSSIAREEEASEEKLPSNGVSEVPVATASPDSIHRCRNCETELMGVYCYNCGQKTDVRRLSLTSLFRGAAEQVLNLDSAYLRTFVGMIRRPGKLISAYAAGRRKPYINPISFFLLTITFTVILRWAAADMGLWQLVSENATEPSVDRYISNHRWIVNSLIQPPLACVLTLLFWQSGRNVAENFAFGFFVTGMAFLYMSIGEFIGFHLFGPGHLGTFALIVLAFIASLCHAGIGFYKQRAVYVILKMILGAVLSLVMAYPIVNFLAKPLLAHILPLH